MFAAALLAVASAFAVGNASLEPQPARVDLIEVNRYYDEDGKHLLDQVIFYDWNRAESRYWIVAWKPLKKRREYPRPTAGGEFSVAWREAGGVRREVEAPKLRTTYTQYDPEEADRKALPPEERRGLPWDR